MRFEWPWLGAAKPRAGRAERASADGSIGVPADLARLPLGLDLRAINLTEGVRAALATAVILVLNHWLAWPPLTIAAIAAQLTCFCDVGGSLRQRLPPLLAFSVLGALTWGAFGLLRGLGPAAVLPAVALGLVANSSARVWGLPAQAVGNVLTVVLALALDRPLDLPEALVLAAAFLGGALWAVFLTAVIWQAHPDRPARRAVAQAWRLLAVLATDLKDLVGREQAAQTDWEGHARLHRRAVREAIERARAVVAELVRSRGPLSRRAAQNVVRLEAADQLFGALIGLSDVLENMAEAEGRAAAARLLRLLPPTLALLGRSIQANETLRPATLERATRRMQADTAGVPELRGLVDVIVVRLRIAAGFASPDGDILDALAAPPTVPLRQRILAPLTANLTWQSAVLRHAVRAAIVGTPIVAVSLIWAVPFEHWLTITVVLTMQPYFAATWQRALERIGGTLLGALIGAAIAFAPQGSLAQALLLFPLSVIGFSARQVSYGTFIACLTPMIVILIEVVEPGQSPWAVAGLRVLFTVGGGALAVLASMLLWPTWEADRLGLEMRAAIRAYGRYAELVLAAAGGPVPSTVETARAGGGRGQQQSRGIRVPGPAGAGADRVGPPAGHDRRRRRPPPHRRLPAGPSIRGCYRGEKKADPLAGLGIWTSGALAAIADGRTPEGPAPDAAGSEILARIARSIELLGGAAPRT